MGAYFFNSVLVTALALALLLVVSLTILFLSLREEEKLPTGRNFKTTASTGESTSSGK